MSLDYLTFSILIFQPALVAGAAIGGVFLVAVAVMDGAARLLARLK